MKRMLRICCTLALLLLSLSAVPAANAALAKFSPNPALLNGISVGGIPSWYQDINGVSVQPCFDPPATCGLIGLGDPMFNEALPLSYPGNFPSEAFYSDVVAQFAVGPADARVILAMEYTFIDAATGALIGAPPRPANALGVPFQRHRLVISYPPGVVPSNGPFTISHPWGQTIFPVGAAKCVNNAGGQKCSMTRDLPLPGAIPPNFAAALGTGIVGTQSTFVSDPLAPAGFLGSATAVAAFVGADPAAVGGAGNAITVTDGLNTGTTTSLTLLVGKTIGMEVLPGNKLTFSANIVPPAGFVAVPQTVTVTNTTGAAITFTAALATTGADATDFIIAPPTQAAAPAPALADCSAAGATVAAGASCGFDVTFTPAAKAVAARAATIALAPTVVAPAVAPPPITMNLAGTALVDVTTAAVGHGTIAPVTAAVGAGTAVTFTVTPESKKFKVRDVTDSAAPAASVPASPTDPASFTITGANIGAVNHAITATFMPSGDLDANGTLDVADAQKALRIVAGIQKADADDPDNTAVKVAPLVGGKPAPVATRVTPNIGDVLVILRRVVNLDTW